VVEANAGAYARGGIQVRGTDDGRTGARGDDPLALKRIYAANDLDQFTWNLQCTFSGGRSSGQIASEG